MQIVNVKQGTDEWKALRLKHRTASEASAMMGASKNVKRSELLHMKATGSEQEFSDWVQKNLLDKGHEIEAKARPLAEAFIGEELYPVTAVDDNDYLLASYDGLVMLQTEAWECKSGNEDKTAAVLDGRVPDEDFWQVVQHTAVGAERVLYTVTDGTKENTVHVWYERNDDDIKKLMAGWAQFDEDLANYQHVEQAAPVAAEPVKDLPAVSVKVSGSIDVVDNFKVFEEALRDFIDNRLIQEPRTDQDFADLDAQIKALKKAEAALDAAEKQLLSQVATIDEIKRTKDMLHKLARDNRLMAEKLLKHEKDKRRAEILQRGKDAFSAHIDSLAASLSENIGMPPIMNIADFAGVMKGLKTITSLNDAVDTELARAKIEANQIADGIRANLKTLDEFAADHRFLFNDLQQIVTKPGGDFTALVKLRIAEHKEAEEKRLDEERERIRQEEEAKAKEAVAQDAPKEASDTPDESFTVRTKVTPKQEQEDIVHRLRLAALSAPQEFASLMQLAADEIDRLRGKIAA